MFYCDSDSDIIYCFVIFLYSSVNIEKLSKNLTEHLAMPRKDRTLDVFFNIEAL